MFIARDLYPSPNGSNNIIFNNRHNPFDQWARDLGTVQIFLGYGPDKPDTFVARRRHHVHAGSIKSAQAKGQRWHLYFHGDEIGNVMDVARQIQSFSINDVFGTHITHASVARQI